MNVGSGRSISKPEQLYELTAEGRYNSRLVGNPEVIRKLALGNRSDGFRSCLTRSHLLPLSSVARPEKCRPTQTKQEHEHSIGKSEYVNQGELKGRLGQARPLWRTVPLLGERNLFRVMISRTGLSSAGRVSSWGATIAGNDLPLSICAVPCVDHHGMHIECASVVNATPGADQSYNSEVAVRFSADIAHRIFLDFGVVEEIQPVWPLGHQFTIPTVEREFRRHQLFYLQIGRASCRESVP